MLLLKGDPSLTDAPQLHSCVCCDFTLELGGSQASWFAPKLKFWPRFIALLAHPMVPASSWGGCCVAHCCWRNSFFGVLLRSLPGGRLPMPFPLHVPSLGPQQFWRQTSALTCHATCVFERKTWDILWKKLSSSECPNCGEANIPALRDTDEAKTIRRFAARSMKTGCLPLPIKTWKCNMKAQFHVE